MVALKWRCGVWLLRVFGCCGVWLLRMFGCCGVWLLRVFGCCGVVVSEVLLCGSCVMAVHLRRCRGSELGFCAGGVFLRRWLRRFSAAVALQRCRCEGCVDEARRGGAGASGQDLQRRVPVAEPAGWRERRQHGVRHGDAHRGSHPRPSFHGTRSRLVESAEKSEC